MVKHEVIIVGGGTGGLRAAIISAKSGYDTALIEPGKMGGTCLNTGCIPTKILIHAAEIYNEIKNCGELGLKAENTSFDFDKVMGRMRDIVTSGRKHAEESVERIENLTLYKEKAKFTSENSIIAGDTEISADKIIVATGTHPWAPPINGLDETGYLTNEGALELEELPESMIAIGGGYIACELACFFASMGTKVTILERMPNILSVLDEDLSEFMHERLEELGIEIHTNINTLEIKGANGQEVEVVTNDVRDENSPKESFKSQYLLVSTGRRPSTKGLDLEKAGVETEKGYVTVNSHLKTSNENIYAIGDVNGKAPFAHAAKVEARIALENCLLGKDTEMEHDLVPWAAFTFPSVSGIGISEKDAKEKDIDYGIMKADYSRTGKAKIIDKQKGFVKIIYDKKTRNVLGARIIGEQGHNLIHEIVLLMNTPKPKIDYLLKATHIHPTLSEVMEELREA